MYLNPLTKKCILEEFSVIWQRLLICLNHEIFLPKLHFYGIRGISEDWFRFYLTNRRQKVEVKSPNTTRLGYTETWSSPRINSRASNVHNIYINDLSLRISSIFKTILFADDTSVTISSINFDDFSSVSNLVLSLMIKWFAANKLVLNLGKQI